MRIFLLPVFIRLNIEKKLRSSSLRNKNYKIGLKYFYFTSNFLRLFTGSKHDMGKLTRNCLSEQHFNCMS